MKKEFVIVSRIGGIVCFWVSRNNFAWEYAEGTKFSNLRDAFERGAKLGKCDVVEFYGLDTEVVHFSFQNSVVV